MTSHRKGPGWEVPAPEYGRALPRLTINLLVDERTGAPNHSAGSAVSVASPIAALGLTIALTLLGCSTETRTSDPTIIYNNGNALMEWSAPGGTRTLLEWGPNSGAPGGVFNLPDGRIVTSGSPNLGRSVLVVVDLTSGRADTLADGRCVVATRDRRWLVWCRYPEAGPPRLVRQKLTDSIVAGDFESVDTPEGFEPDFGWGAPIPVGAGRIVLRSRDGAVWAYEPDVGRWEKLPIRGADLLEWRSRGGELIVEKYGEQRGLALVDLASGESTMLLSGASVAGAIYDSAQDVVYVSKSRGGLFEKYWDLVAIEIPGGRSRVMKRELYFVSGMIRRP